MSSSKRRTVIERKLRDSNQRTDRGAEENIGKGRQGRGVPRTAAWGKLMIGVPYNDPNTPPFEL